MVLIEGDVFSEPFLGKLRKLHEELEALDIDVESQGQRRADRDRARGLAPIEGGGPKAKGKKGKKGKKDATSFLLSPVLVETFVITFLAEWGDRSQIATIGLAASSDPVGVTIGGIAGHAVCTGAAVIGGRHMAEHISERAVAIAGGVLFCLFGAHSLVTGLEE